MALFGFKKELQEFDWNNLVDTESVGTWPNAVKLIVVMALFAICLVLGFWTDIRNLQAKLSLWQEEESKLRVEYEQKASIAASLVEHKMLVKTMENAFSALLLQLPSQTEVPDLVDDITESGLGSGLVFSRIELGAEVVQEFYIEQPMQVEVFGHYHDFGAFVSSVANLPRIVTLHDFSIRPLSNGSALQMTIAAKTYRYRGEEEFDANAL